MLTPPIAASLFNVQYQINGPRAWLAVRTASAVFTLDSTQDGLLARAPEGATTWGDAETLAEAQAQLDARFGADLYVVALAPAEEA